jgi:bifunctional UDP-N-acetylglucosamine pyrophosphorylase/glucosamine-1-phosphate N-acetyltransferase
MQAMPDVPDAARVLVLYGDVPLLMRESLAPLVQAPRSLAVLTAEPADPTGYGRVMVDARGNVCAIVEQKDATPEQRAVRLINTGIIAADASKLRAWLAQLRNDNAQGEFYLTDVFALAAADGEHAAIPCHVPTRWMPSAPTTPGSWPTWSALPAPLRTRAVRRARAWPIRALRPARRLAVGRDVEIDVERRPRRPR